jgi:hypothetical protein
MEEDSEDQIPSADKRALAIVGGRRGNQKP